MSYQSPSSKRGEDRTGSRYGDTNHGKRAEQMYGEPCHEVQSNDDEQTLYGEPQHEIREGDSDLPDLELLFVRMRAESDSGSTLSGRSGTLQVETTEK